MTNSTETAPAPVGVVIFDWEEWSKRYPSLASGMAEEQGQENFDTACLYLNNTPASIVMDLKERKQLLYLLTAHIAYLDLNAGNGTKGSGNGGMVGRISSASRGSVSASADGAGIPGSAWWYTQSRFGAAFVQATLKYRRMRMVVGRPHPAKIWP